MICQWHWSRFVNWWVILLGVLLSPRLPLVLATRRETAIIFHSLIVTIATNKMCIVMITMNYNIILYIFHHLLTAPVYWLWLQCVIIIYNMDNLMCTVVLYMCLTFKGHMIINLSVLLTYQGILITFCSS